MFLSGHAADEDLCNGAAPYGKTASREIQRLTFMDISMVHAGKIKSMHLSTVVFICVLIDSVLFQRQRSFVSALWISILFCWAILYTVSSGYSRCGSITRKMP